MPSDDPKTLLAAFRYKASGLRAMPLRGKRPSFLNWETRTLDVAELRDWWRMLPGANVGLVMGRDPANPDAPCLVCVDVDPRNGGDAWEAGHREALLQAGAAVARTGGGGRHYFFRHPMGGWIASGTNKVAPGVDLKADGGHQVVAAPSIHPETGVAYEWETVHTASEMDMLGDLPTWIAVPTGDKPAASTRNRHETYTDLPADVLSCRDRMRALAPAQEGQGGDAATFRAACIGRDHDLSPEVFWPMLQEWNEACQPPWDETELRTKLKRAYLYAKDEKGGKGVAGLPSEPIIRGGENDPDAGPIRPGRKAKGGDPAVMGELAGRVIAEEAEDEALAYIHEIHKTRDGGWRDHISSADIMLRHDSRLARLFRRNLLTGEIELQGRIPWRITPGPLTLTDRDLEGIATWVATAAMPGDQGGLLSLTTWHSAINLAAERNAYHPVRDWLDSLAWDGVSRLDKAAETYFGAAEPIAQVFMAKWMIAAIARVRVPGPAAKMDAALVLEGFQGLGKTTSLSRLFGDSWSAELRGVDPEDKDTSMKLRGVWVAEFSEMAGFGKKEQAVWKSFISATEDRQRDPYARTVTTWPRQCVLAATTNSTAYLTDETGNRRWWPILCRKADYEALAQDRAQLWAEAQIRWHGGQTWNDPHCAWRLTKDEIKLASAAQAARHIGDVWDDAFIEWSKGRDFFTFSDFWEGCLQRSQGLAKNEDMQHLGRVVRQQGWERAKRYAEGEEVRGYSRTDRIPDRVGARSVNAPTANASGREPGLRIKSTLPLF